MLELLSIIIKTMKEFNGLNFGYFNIDDLILFPIQYKIIHKNVDDFKVGEKVFLKSNPETEMEVIYLNEEDNVVICQWYFKDEKHIYEFIPQCILQFKYASEMKYKNKELNIN